MQLQAGVRLPQAQSWLLQPRRRRCTHGGRQAVRASATQADDASRFTSSIINSWLLRGDMADGRSLVCGRLERALHAEAEEKARSTAGGQQSRRAPGSANRKASAESPAAFVAFFPSTAPENSAETANYAQCRLAVSALLEVVMRSRIPAAHWKGRTPPCALGCAPALLAHALPPRAFSWAALPWLQVVRGEDETDGQTPQRWR
jgi:hypothetical protein